MHERPSPRPRYFALLAALLIAVPAAVSLAQAPQPAPSPPAVQADAASDEREQGAPDVSAPDSAAAAQPTGPLEDYEASEQISEDLSVAFPVDI